jgi:CheY-like chemotaxis protein
MGGDLRVSSAPGEGSRFWIDLAKADAPVVEPAPPGAPAEALAEALAELAYRERRYVLYVEDVGANIRLVEEILKRRPMIDLVSVMSGGIALELVRQRTPDLLLLDLHLPDLSGEEVLRRVRQDERTRDMRVVVLSADATRPQQERLAEAGADRYLTKPVKVAALLAMVDELLAT